MESGGGVISDIRQRFKGKNSVLIPSHHGEGQGGALHQQLGIDVIAYYTYGCYYGAFYDNVYEVLHLLKLSALKKGNLATPLNSCLLCLINPRG